MSSRAAELYKETLLRHGREPSNRQALPDATHQAKLANALCGDEITVYLKLRDNRIEKAAFEAQCCSICVASASMLTERVRSQPATEAQAFSRSLIAHLKADAPSPEADAQAELHALDGVKAFASRIRCATLPWEALHAALAESDGPAIQTDP